MATATKRRKKITKTDGSINKAEEIRKAAKELGGTLTAQSDGPVKGATFALELPKNLPHAPNASEAHSQP